MTDKPIRWGILGTGAIANTFATALASLDDAVTVVEWGEGLAEALSESGLEVRIERAVGGDAAAVDDGADGELDPRVVRVRGWGPRWVGAVAP